MYRVLLGAGALLLATSAVPAAAHDWDYNGSYGGGSYGSGYYGGGSYYGNRGYYGYGNQDYDDIVRQHVRACRQHARLHEALNDIHSQLHDEGFDDNGDHQVAHEALDDAHQQYHEDHPEAQNCGYWYSQYRYLNRGYDRPYGYWSYRSNY